jgi:hypothetical protein
MNYSDDSSGHLEPINAHLMHETWRNPTG